MADDSPSTVSDGCRAGFAGDSRCGPPDCRLLQFFGVSPDLSPRAAHWIIDNEFRRGQSTDPLRSTIMSTRPRSREICRVAAPAKWEGAVRAPLPINPILRKLRKVSSRVTQRFDVTLCLDGGRKIFPKNNSARAIARWGAPGREDRRGRAAGCQSRRSVFMEE